MPPPPPSPETHWTDVEGAENIHHLTETNFESFMREHESVLVMFYAPCKLAFNCTINAFSYFDILRLLDSHEYRYN